MQESTYRDFLKRIDRKADRKKFPLSVMFELTYRCNFKCAHCYIAPERGRKELNTKQVFSILEQLAQMGCFHLGFTGGEIFLREDIFDIISYAKRLGFDTGLLTNGSLINKQNVEKLSDFVIRGIEISILGITKKVFESVSGVRGSFERVYAAINLLKERKIPTLIKATLIRQNFRELDAMRLFAERTGLRFSYGYIVTPKNNRNIEPLRYRLSPEIVDRMERESGLKEKQIKKFSDGCDFRKNLKPFFCAAGKKSIAINPYGEMKLCLDMPYPRYDILKIGVKEGWKRIKDFVFNFQFSPEFKCNKCKLIFYCQWCPARGWLEEGNLNACIPYYKKLALLQSLQK